MNIDQRVAVWDIQRVGEIPCQVTSPAPRETWKVLLENDGEALVFQTPAWLDAICAAGPYTDASRLYEFSGGRQLLLPIAARQYGIKALTDKASLPHSWGMGGLVGPGPVTTEQVSAVFADLTQRNVMRTFIRPNPVFAQSWSEAKPANVIAVPRLAHVLDLSGGFDQVWSKRFTSETRTSVRKAEKSGLTVECDTTGKLVPVFYDLFTKSVDRWAEQQHEPRWLAQWRGKRRDSIRKFYQIAQALGDACQVWVAWLEKKPVAAILVLIGKNASYTRGAMDKDLAGPTRANQLLHRYAIEAACLAGCRRYHMGESGRSSSLAQFKSRFGAVPAAYADYTIERLPLTAMDRAVRGTIKRLVAFKDME